MKQSTELKWLEKVWMAEVENRLPFQSKAAIMRRLESDGLVQPYVMMLGGTMPVSVSGWQLTHAGRFFYCSSCGDNRSDG